MRGTFLPAHGASQREACIAILSTSLTYFPFLISVSGMWYGLNHPPLAAIPPQHRAHVAIILIS